MADCGCSYQANPLRGGCSSETRSRNIAMLIREGYDPKQAAAIAYAEQRRHGCKVPRRKGKKMRKNPPYAVYGTHETLLRRYDQDLGEAATYARARLHSFSPDEEAFDKLVVYDESRMDRGPKGEFVAMFRPNKNRRERDYALEMLRHQAEAIMFLKERPSPRNIADLRYHREQFAKYYFQAFGKEPPAGTIPNKRRRRKAKRNGSTYKANPGVVGLAVLGLAAIGAWALYSKYKKPAATTASPTSSTLKTVAATVPVRLVR